MIILLLDVQIIFRKYFYLRTILACVNFLISYLLFLILLFLFYYLSVHN